MERRFLEMKANLLKFHKKLFKMKKSISKHDSSVLSDASTMSDSELLDYLILQIENGRTVDEIRKLVECNPKVVNALVLVHADWCFLRKDLENRTLLQMATINSNIGMVKFLVESGAPLNEKDKYGWTALHHAASHQMIFIYLLQQEKIDGSSWNFFTLQSMLLIKTEILHYITYAGKLWLKKLFKQW